MSILVVKRGPWVANQRTLTVDGWCKFIEHRILGGCSYRLLDSAGDPLTPSSERRSQDVARMAQHLAVIQFREQHVLADERAMTEHYWDCNCSEWQFIHSKVEKRCKFCDSREPEQADSRILDVLDCMSDTRNWS